MKSLFLSVLWRPLLSGFIGGARKARHSGIAGVIVVTLLLGLTALIARPGAFALTPQIQLATTPTSATPAPCQAGTLDTSFNGTGTVTTQIGRSNDYGRSVAIQSDGKMVVAGYSYSALNVNFSVVRYNSNGSLDTSFNNTGKVTTPIGSSSGFGYSVAIQSDGKIVVAGTSDNDFAVIRYNSDGSLDTSFNGTGKVTTSISSYYDNGYSVAIQSDGKIVVAGRSESFYYDFAVVRYNSDGSLDTSFNGTGKVTTPVGDRDSVGYSVAIQGDGKIVVAGYSDSDPYPNYDFAVVRYNSDGSLDTSFNGTGIVTTPMGSLGNDSDLDDVASSVAIQGDGKIVAAGNSGTYPNYDFAVIRYNSNGSLDTSFNTTGIVTTPIGGNTDRGRSVAIQSDGKIVIAGSSDNGSDDDFAVVRYNSDGSLDTSFNGTGGIVTTAIGSSTDQGRSVAIQSDGRIVVAGSSLAGSAGFTLAGSDDDFAVVRYNSNGSLDTSFNSAGIVTTSVGGGDDFGRSVAIQSDGKVVVAGYSLKGSRSDFAVVRYNNDSSLDTSFNGTGVVSTPIGIFSDYGYSVAIQADGKIVVAGYSSNGPPYFGTGLDFAVVCYNSDGSLDTSFNGTGKVTTDIGGDDDVGYSVAIQGDGKIVVAGYSVDTSQGTTGFAVVRYNSNGSLDTSLNGTGKMTTHIDHPDDAGGSVAIQGDGKIVVAGYSYNYNARSYDLAVVRYNSDGSLDSSFNTTGIVTTPIGSRSDYGQSVALQGDGKIVVAGYSWNGSNYDFAIVRYNNNGSLDTSLNGTGKVTTPIGSGNDVGRSVAIQGDDKIVVAGYSRDASEYADFAVVRYNRNGSLDNSFNGTGIMTTPIGSGHDYGYSVAIQGDGEIVVAGHSDNGSNLDFAVVRYIGDSCCTAPAARSVVSRKLHGVIPFDIPLPGVECRSGGAGGDYQVVFTFASPVTFNSADVSSGLGRVALASGSGTNTITVDLTGVTNAQDVTVALNCVSDGATTGNVIGPQMGVLVGDVNGSGVVTSGDTNLCKAQALQPLTNGPTGNFRNDINASGAITTGDVNIIKQNALAQLP